jgi:hypothetical protein
MAGEPQGRFDRLPTGFSFDAASHSPWVAADRCVREHGGNTTFVASNRAFLLTLVRCRSHHPHRERRPD